MRLHLMHQPARFAPGGNEIIPTPADVARRFQTQHPVGERVALVVVEKEPAVEALLAERGPADGVIASANNLVNPALLFAWIAVMKTADGVTLVSEFNIGAGLLPNWVVQGDKGTLFIRENEIEIHRVREPEPAFQSACLRRNAGMSKRSTPLSSSACTCAAADARGLRQTVGCSNCS